MPDILSHAQMTQLRQFRQALHRRPELSGREIQTARTVVEALAPLAPDALITGLGSWTETDGTCLGGTGIAAVFGASDDTADSDGATLLFRCELDGLPIEEQSTLPYRSESAQRGHLCGHDGHMAILTGLAMRLSQARPGRGRVVLLFQPAEETGRGARAVLSDPAFAPLKPDYAFALHNLPGLPMGSLQVREGAMCCASRGVRFRFKGKTSHASMPQDGTSPVDAIMAVAEGLKTLSNGLIPGQKLDETYQLVTITHVRIGEPCFGVAPGRGELWATFRTVDDAAMAAIIEAAHQLALREAGRNDLVMRMVEDDVFDACTNAPETTQMIVQAAHAESIPVVAQEEPMRFSEDFGQFGQHCPASLFLLGSGEGQPQLHNPDFDFPDALIEPGIRLFERIIRDRLG